MLPIIFISLVRESSITISGLVPYAAKIKFFILPSIPCEFFSTVKIGSPEVYLVLISLYPSFITNSFNLSTYIFCSEFALTLG